ncbi:hypothetical protein QOT17_011577 [Balamuthia mandrillaris]
MAEPLVACHPREARPTDQPSWGKMVQKLNRNEVAPAVRYREPTAEPEGEVGFSQQRAHALAFAERLGLFFSQRFVSAFVVAVRQIPGIECTLKIAQEAGNAQELLQLTDKPEPPSLDILEMTGFPAAEFVWHEREVVLSLAPPAPIDFARRETIKAPAEGETRWVIVTLPWRKE